MQAGTSTLRCIGYIGCVPRACFDVDYQENEFQRSFHFQGCCEASFCTLKVPYRCDNIIKLDFPGSWLADLSNELGHFIRGRKFFLSQLALVEN